jgi:hypothetical protein
MTITLTREEAQQILDALEQLDGWDTATQGDIVFDPSDEIEILRAQLSAPEPEPVAKFVLADGLNKRVKLIVDDLPIGTLFYTAPPQREWQGLTDEEIEAGFMANTCCDDLVVYEHVASFIEAKLRKKNNG